MTDRARRLLWNVLRVVLTAAFIFVVVRMIRFHDYAHIEGQGDTTEVAKVEPRGGRVTLHWKDGRTSEHAAKDVSERPGFLTLFERTRKGLFFALMIAILVPIFGMAVRWWLLLRGHGFAVPLGRIFFVTYAGIFFNNFLPGSVGGDLARMVLASSGEDRKAAVVGTVLLDRVIGLAAMIVLGAGCLAPFAGRFEDRRLVHVVYGLLAAMLLAYLLYFNPFVRSWIRDRMPFREKIQKTVQELDGVFRSAKEKKGLVAQAALISVAAQAASILVIYGLSRAMGIRGAELWAFFVFEPIIFIVTAVPLSVGGWGVQEWAYAFLFGTFTGMDPSQAIALSVLYKLSLILVSVPGGVLFALGAARRR